MTADVLNAQYQETVEYIDPGKAIKPGSQTLENLELRTITVTS